MQNKLISPIEEIYFKYLETVGKIKFSRREVDIIACLLKGRTTKKIAYLLSISPKTVATHIRNIMLKLEKNSREGILDFVEKANKYNVFQAYYDSLLISINFETILKQISKLIHFAPFVCTLIFYGDRKDKESVISLLETHLNTLGIKVILQEKCENPKDLFVKHSKSSPSYCFHIVTSNDENSKKILNKANKSSVFDIFIFFEEAFYEKEIPKERYLNYKEYENYYFFFLELLKRILPKLNLQDIIARFKKDCENRENIVTKKNNIYTTGAFFVSLFSFLNQKKKWKFSFISAMACIALLVSFLFVTFTYQFFHPNQINSLNNNFVRRALNIPNEEVLLDRSELLEQLKSKLKAYSGIQTVSIIGPGGAGKTTLARQFAHLQQAPVTWEVNAETHESLRASFENLANTFAKSAEDKIVMRSIQEINNLAEREEKIIQFVKEHLNLYTDWLLVFDNVEKFTDIQKYFPQDPVTWGHGKIILTTRNSNIQNNIHVNDIIFIGELNANQKLDLFRKIINHGSNEALNAAAQIKEANAFLEHIPHFPLDVSVAAYYLKITNISYASYLESLRKHDKEFEEVQQNLLKEAGDYTKTRYSIITISLKHLIHTHRDFQDLLLFISLLDSQNIPRALLESYKDKALVNNFIYHLKMYSLITNDLCSAAKNSMFSLHRSTQSVILTYLTETLNLKKDDSNFQQIIDILEKYIFDIVHKEDVLKMSLMLSHCERILKHDDLLTPSAKALIRGELGTIYFYLNRYKEAEVLLQQAIKVLKENKKNPNKLGQFLSCLASIYIGLGDGEKSIKYHTESVSTFQKYFPDNHLKIALHLTYLGSVYRDIGEYEKSKNTLEKAYFIFKSKSLENQTGFARNLVDLGKVYRSLGDYEKARVLQEQGFALYKKSLSNDHFRTAWATVYLANTLNDLEKYKEAQNFLEAALQVYKNNFSETHRKTAWVLASLGHSYEGLGQYKKAKEFLEKSLENLSESYFEVVWVLARLGNVCLKLGDIENAKAFFEKSLIILEKTYGKDHVETAKVLRDLGRVYLVTGHIEIADDLINKAVRIFQNSNHPDLCFALEALAEMYVKKSTFKRREEGDKQSKDFQAQAIYHFEHALRLAKVYFLKDSPHITRIQNKMKNLK